jgi:hypothetical protein
MDLTTIDLSKGTYTVRVPRKERSFLASLDDWTFELGAFMWLEGLFEEDPALKGRSAMKHNLILTAPSGANALFEHVCLSADGLEFDYIPHSWGAALPLWEKRVGEVYSHLVDEHGMFEDNHSASQWARNGPRIVSRGLPRVRADWPDGKNITEAVFTRSASFQTTKTNQMRLTFGGTLVYSTFRANATTETSSVCMTKGPPSSAFCPTRKPFLSS